MLRKFLLGSVAALGLLSPLAMTSSASAHEYHRVVEHRVFYRPNCNSPWRTTGCYQRLRVAQHVAEGYRCRGFEAFVR